MKIISGHAVRARDDRYYARANLRGITGLKRVKQCGLSRIGDVAFRLVQHTDGTCAGGLGGLATCGSTWACPQCSARIAERRRNEVKELASGWARKGGGFLLLTFTLRHRKNQRLKDSWNKLIDAWAGVQRKVAWRNARKDGSIAGYVRVVEITHGKNGWHPHLHILVFTDSDKGTELSEHYWRNAITESWIQSLKRVGATAESSHAVDVKRIAAGDALADYFNKATYELAGARTKEGRKTSRNPWQILRHVIATGEDYDLWREYEDASYGRRQWSFSRGLTDLLGVDIAEDDEIVAAENTSGDVVLLADRDCQNLYALLASGRVSRALAVIEQTRGLEQARVVLGRWLTGEGVAWRLPPSDAGNALPPGQRKNDHLPLPRRTSPHPLPVVAAKQARRAQVEAIVQD